MSWSTCDKPQEVGLAKARRRKKLGKRIQEDTESCNGYELEITWDILNESETDEFSITKTFCVTQLCGNQCLPGLLLINGRTILSSTYRAEDITSFSATVESGRNVHFKAAENITLVDGFHAKSGASFTATIESCTSASLQDEVVSRQANAYQLTCLLYTSPSPRDQRGSRMPSSA